MDDWIFYSSGKTLSRMRIDGANNETIYKMGYLLDIHVLGNCIYFINPSDKFTVYRMDVNGQNVESLSQVGNWIFFMSSDDNMYSSQKRLELWSDEITVMD